MDGLGINLPGLITQFVNFGILLLILWIFLFKPLQRVLDATQPHIRAACVAARVRSRCAPRSSPSSSSSSSALFLFDDCSLGNVVILLVPILRNFIGHIE